MSSDPLACVPFRRARFATQLPADRRYTAGHFWVLREEGGTEGAGIWRVGLTQFATRMLGELVEHDFEVKPGAAVKTGQLIGWIEGFKAASDLFCVVEGTFVAGNPELLADLALVDRDPYGRGWLYRVQGTPDAGCVDVAGYVAMLNATIDKLQGKPITTENTEGTEGRR